LVPAPVPVDETASRLWLLNVQNLATKAWHLPESTPTFDPPDAEPREVVATVTQWRTGSDNVDDARRSVDEGNPDLARDLVSNEESDIRLAIAIKIAPLIEGVYAIIPVVLSLKLSAQYLKSPPRHVPPSVDGEWIPRLCPKCIRERSEGRRGDDSADETHIELAGAA